jgi:hypothetical protein
MLPTCKKSTPVLLKQIEMSTPVIKHFGNGKQGWQSWLNRLSVVREDRHSNLGSERKKCIAFILYLFMRH